MRAMAWKRGAGIESSAIETDTGAAIDLQRYGVIRYSHGQVEILDRAGLEAASCECYAVIKNQIDRFLRE